MGNKAIKAEQGNGSDFLIDFYEKKKLEINFIPGTLLLKIFKLVHKGELPSQDFLNITLVCKLWRYYSFHSIISIKLVPEKLQSLLIPYKTSVLDNAIQSIHEMIIQSTSLHTVDLSNSELDRSRAQIISEALKSSICVKNINFEYCYLDCATLSILCQGLAMNTTVTFINFKNNKIGPQGALSIAKCLESNRVLSSVNLSNNEIGNQGAIAIGDVLKSNKSKVKLDLSHNHINGEGVSAIIKARQQNNSSKTSYVYNSGLKFITMNGKCTTTINAS
ncbi:hypothetical protein CYY_001563 [Polysphondylium violaceum]|uniref:F-box domain-containing protein n=1 Tax=Polysphondylium violaceum TaxID=133409 RepID=A0A8J4UW30_9MYCE|nr:hypothetical protein CYY_001563 [Polysphondylium violaceum]